MDLQILEFNDKAGGGLDIKATSMANSNIVSLDAEQLAEVRKMVAGL